MNYYVFHTADLPEYKRTYQSEANRIADQLDKLVEMYRDELLTFEKIEQRTSIPWWTVKELFKKNGIERISLRERARIKRAKNFDLIYHYICILSRKRASKIFTQSLSFHRRMLERYWAIGD